MTLFHYRALSGVGDVVTGDVEARSRRDAVKMLRDQALDPLSLSERRPSGLIGFLNQDVAISPTARLRVRRDFARDLAVLRRAGAPLDQALAILAEGKDAAAKLAGRIGQRSNAGYALSEAARQEPRVFDDASVELMAAGEAAGDIAQALETLADMTERSIATRSEIVRSLAYPAALILAALAAMALMVFHVLPSFEGLFAGSEDRIPPAARIVFAIGSTAKEWADEAGIAVALASMGLTLFWMSARGRQSMDHVLLRLPVIGRLLAGMELGRAMLVMGRLMAAGSTADRAVELAGRTCTNALFRADLARAAARIREGAAVAPAIEGVRYVPSRALRMIAIGEASGTLPRMLGEVAQILQDSASTGIKTLLAVLPSVLTVVIGILVAGLIYAVLTALLSVNELAF